METQIGQTRIHDSTTGTAWTERHRIQLLTQHVVALSNGEAEQYATGRAAARRIAVRSAVVRGWNGSEAGSAHGQYGEHQYDSRMWTSTALRCEVVRRRLLLTAT